MSANYGQFRLDMSKSPTFSVGELKELALEASEKIPDARDFEHLMSKVAPLLFNKNVYAACLVGLAVIEYSKHVMTELRELEPGQLATGVIAPEVLFEKPRSSEQFCALLLEEADQMEKITTRPCDEDAQNLVDRVMRRLGANRDEVTKLLGVSPTQESGEHLLQ